MLVKMPERGVVEGGVLKWRLMLRSSKTEEVGLKTDGKWKIVRLDLFGGSESVTDGDGLGWGSASLWSTGLS